MIAEYVNGHHEPVPIQKADYRNYIYGTRNITVEDDHKLGPVVVLQNGNGMKLKDFLEYYTRDELSKLADLREGERAVLSNKADHGFRKSTRSSQYNYRD